MKAPPTEPRHASTDHTTESHITRKPQYEPCRTQEWLKEPAKQAPFDGITSRVTDSVWLNTPESGKVSGADAGKPRL